MYPIKANKLTMTSSYGNRTYTYQGKKVSDFHHGIDLVANPNNRNEDILAFADGTVTSVQKTGAQYGTGCYVRINHGNGYYTLYYHMKSGSITVNKGDKVKKGQKIGVIGTTGQSTGVHLHFQIDKGSNSSSINPYDYVFNGKELPKPTPSNPSTSTKFKVGDKVKFTGTLYRDSAGNGAGSSKTNMDAVVSIVKAGANCPYNINNGLGWVKESSLTAVVTYATGNYKCNENMNVRSGAGTNYAIKKVKDLSTDGRKNATSSNLNDNAVYKAGTIFTAQQIINQNGVWAKTPSGYVCIKGSNGTVFCTKC